MAAASYPPGLIDTDILVDGERGAADAVAFLTSQFASGGFRLSVISAMELTIGCRDKNELQLLRQVLSHAEVVQITPAVSQQALAWVEAFFLSHGLLIPDALIGATTVTNNLPLYTMNIRHFQMLPGLTTLRPY